jgi:NAD(P)-dependent dehydrogenase (short-subunit alcohol dehydrogenase family)
VLDVTDEAQVAEAARTATDVALLINNAGYWGESSAFTTLDVAKGRREMDVNYVGLLSVTSVFALALKASSGSAVLNVLSFLALATWPVSGTYAASKAATLAVTRSRRAELAAQGTAVIGVMPVQVDTGMGQIMPPPRRPPRGRRRCLGRRGTGGGRGVPRRTVSAERRSVRRRSQGRPGLPLDVPSQARLDNGRSIPLNMGKVLGGGSSINMDPAST